MPDDTTGPAADPSTDPPTGPGPTGPTASDGLTGTVLSGGRRLIVRQLFGLVVGGVGGFALLRLIGPREYGVYATAFEICFFAQLLAELNLDVFLVRRPTITRETYDVVATLLAISAVAATVILLAATPLLARLEHLDRFGPVAAVMFASVPVMHAQQVPLSHLERELRYAEVSRVEMLAQLAFPVVAIPLAMGGAGVWSAVAGWWVQQLVLLVTLWRSAPIRVRLDLTGERVHEALTFGSASVSSAGAYSARNLVAPLLLGHLLGSAAVGYVSLCQRILDTLAVAKQVVFRLSIAVLAKVAHQRDRLLAAVGDGLLLQSVGIGVPIAGFAAAGGMLVPLVFGRQWHPVVALFPLIATSYLTWTVFSVEGAALLTQRRPWSLAAINALNSGLLAAAAIVFVPRLGLTGYGLAELVTTVSVVAQHVVFTRRFGRPRLGIAVLWLAAADGACLLSRVTPAGVALLLIPLAVPAARDRLSHYLRLVLGRGGPAPAPRSS